MLTLDGEMNPHHQKCVEKEDQSLNKYMHIYLAHLTITSALILILL